jgi:hypothetical protein
MALTSQLGTTDSTLVADSMVAGLGAIVDPLIQNLSHNLNLIQSTGPIIDVASFLGLIHGVVIELLIDDFQAVGHTLGLSGTAVTDSFPFLVQDVGLTQTVEVLNFGPVVQQLFLGHIVAVGQPKLASASSTIAFVSSVGKCVEVEVTQNLGLVDFATDVQKHELGLSHNVMSYVNNDPHFQQALGLSHSVLINLEYALSPSSIDIVSQAVAYWIDDGTKCVYNDFNRFGTLGAEPFTAQTGAKLSFTSLDGSSDIVFLRNPETDDRDRLGFTRINRETSGGELQVYRDPTWPLVNTLQGTIVGLKLADVEDLLTFFGDHLGEEISLQDWHGRFWRGVIMNPGEPAVEDTRDRWTVAFEFEGVEMPGPDIIQSVGISHGLSVIQILTRDPAHNLGLTGTAVVVLDDVQHNGDNVQYKGFEVTYSG